MAKRQEAPSTSLQPDKLISTSRGLMAISPIIVFLVLYLVVSLVLNDFYKMPICVALLAASMWSIVIFRGNSVSNRIEVFSRAASHSNIIYMLWIFILAGAFSSVAKEIGAVSATVSLAVENLPAFAIVPGLFATACFISLAVGTSVGTVVALAPLAVEIAAQGGGDVAFLVAVVLGGAFFGDNLSFISDTTIASTRSQGCDMADKFKTNLWIAVPAAVMTLVVYIFLDYSITSVNIEANAPSWLIIPYILVIVSAIARINVTIVLTLGIISAILCGIIKGLPVLELMGFLGNGIDSMGDLIIITLLSAGMLGVVKELGGIDWILGILTKHVSGRRGAQGVVALLVGIVNLCTANNTVSIITVGSISRNISRRFDISPRKSASLLDTCSCIVQCLIPYGAQTLLATSLAGISPAAPFAYLYYPFFLILMVTLAIVFDFPRYRR